ncbi:hypothetical protein BDV10DRAFT_187372 [Aspergillus recurvatus]
MSNTRLATVPRKEPLPVTTAVVKDMSPPKRSPATVVVRSVTSLANAPKPVKTIAPLAARNATSVDALVTLPGTALKVAATEVASEAAMVVDSRLATPAAVSATWPVTAPKARSATTAERQATFRATVPRRPRVSGFAISASNPATSRARAPTTS